MSDLDENSLRRAAIAYAEAAWPVFPLHTLQGSGCSCGKADCSKVAKHPRIANWQNDASSDVATVAAWWSQWPDANIGLSLDGLCVLDVDPKNGGFESLAALEKEYEPLAARARQRSGSGGWHYLMEQVKGVETKRGLRPGLDLLTGAGCYIVAAPSIHACGDRYQWVDDPHPLSFRQDSIILLAPPAWLLQAASDSTKGKAPQRAKKLFSLPDEIGEGKRDTTLTSAAGKIRRAGFSADEILAALRQMNQERCKPPLPDVDVQRIAKSIGRKQPAPMDEDAGFTKELAAAITESDHFARDKGGLLYHWESGVYRATGPRIIERRVKELCETWERTKAWTPELATRVEQWILVDCAELWERPPLDTLNCRNGLLDIATRTLREHSPEYLSPVQIAASFDPTAKCPENDKFIRDVFPSDTQHLPAEITAWLMLPDTSIQKAVLLLGEGANGKSVWLNWLLTFLGRENVSALSLHKIEGDKFAAARLVGKLVNIGSDLPTAALAGTSMFKALTGSDAITAERKYEASFEFQPFVRLIFSANSPPRSDDSTHGFFRRWLVVPFNRTFDESDPDTVPRAVLDARLSQPGELSGVLNKALDALAVIRQGRFTESGSTRDALTEFRCTTDPLAVWLDQNTVERPDAFIPKDRLRSAYAQMCQDIGRPIMPDSQFTAALKRLRPKVAPAQRRVNGKPIRVFIGMGFMTQESVPGEGLF